MRHLIKQSQSFLSRTNKRRILIVQSGILYSETLTRMPHRLISIRHRHLSRLHRMAAMSFALTAPSQHLPLQVHQTNLPVTALSTRTRLFASICQSIRLCFIVFIDFYACSFVHLNIVYLHTLAVGDVFDGLSLVQDYIADYVTCQLLRASGFFLTI